MYFEHVSQNFDKVKAQIDWMLDANLFLAEKIPSYRPDLGPDQFAAWICGGEFKFSESSMGTNWVDATVSNWRDVFPLKIKEDSPAWRKIIKLSRALAEHCKERCIVATCDLHSNADALSALRGGQNLCMDFLRLPRFG